MRKLAVLLAMVVMSGCGDSTQDVAIDPVVDTGTVADTIVTKDDLTLEYYLADNPRAAENEASLRGNEGIQQGFDRLVALGCLPDGNPSTFVHVVDIHGRTLETTWFPFSDPADPNATAGVVHVRSNESEYVMPLRVPSGASASPASAGDVASRNGAGEWGPDLSLKTMWGNCAAFLTGMFQACVSACMMENVPAIACRKACMVAMIAAWIACIFFTIVG